MIIKIQSASGSLPLYETEGAAGMDLRAWLPAPVVLAPGERLLVATGIALEIPVGWEGQVRARSGLAVKFGIGLVNGVGTIDSDYRGEIKVPLINWGNEPFEIKNGDRIAQLVIARYERVQWQETEVNADTPRGAGGFGHTGR